MAALGKWRGESWPPASNHTIPRRESVARCVFGRLAAVLLCCLCFSSTAGIASAQEGTHYLPGVFNVQDFAAPADSGVFTQLFLIYYTTDEFRDRDGDRLRSVDPGTGPVPLNVEIDAFVTYPAIYWMTGKKFLGADVGFAAGLPIQNVDISASLPSLGLNAKDEAFGLGDLMLQPIYLGWHVDRFDFMAGYLFYAPTGRYDEGENDNLGLGYWTHELQGSIVYRGGEDRLWTLGAMLTYDFHTNRRGIDIRPGDTMTVEWGATRIFPQFMIELGLTGYSQLQTTDDKGSDVVRDRDIHDAVHAVGFQTSWTSQSQKINIALRYLNEFYAEDRFKGDLTVFTITYAF